MKMFITTDGGHLIHSMKYIEELDMDIEMSTDAILDFVREAQKTAKFFASRQTKDSPFYSQREIANLITNEKDT